MGNDLAMGTLYFNCDNESIPFEFTNLTVGTLSDKTQYENINKNVEMGDNMNNISDKMLNIIEKYYDEKKDGIYEKEQLEKDEVMKNNKYIKEMIKFLYEFNDKIEEMFKEEAKVKYILHITNSWYNQIKNCYVDFLSVKEMDICKNISYNAEEERTNINMQKNMLIELLEQTDTFAEKQELLKPIIDNINSKIS